MTAVRHTSDGPSGQVDRLAAMEQDHFWFVGRDRLVDHLLDRHSSRSAIVDLGCGTGRFARRLAATGHDVIAIDLRPTGELGPPGRTIAGDAEHVPLRSGSVGTVLARDVLEHVDDGAALRECHRILVSGGVLIALVPGWPSLWSDRDVRAGHLRRYRRSALRAQLRSAGFKVVELRGYQFFLLPVAIASRVVSRWVGARVIDREESPAGLLNRVFGAVNRFEADLARRPSGFPPTGSTLAVVAARP